MGSVLDLPSCVCPKPTDTDVTVPVRAQPRLALPCGPAVVASCQERLGYRTPTRLEARGRAGWVCKVLVGMAQVQSTRCGARPQAILHPSGNRGADLVETIRLERLSAAVADKGPGPDSRLFIRPHHTDVSEQTRSMRPGVGGLGERPWAEKRWTRPASAGVISTHSASALQEMLDETEGAGSNINSRLGSPVPHGVHAASPGVATSRASSVNAKSLPATRPQSRARPQSAHTLAEMRQRQRLQQDQEANQERVMRKLKEAQAAAAAKQEKDFHDAWEQFHSEQNGPVADIEKMLRLKDMEAMRRASAHAKEWNEEVFERIQTQVTRALRKREANGAYNTRWRTAQDQYLETLAKKDRGLFRDIIIEEEYDPLDAAAGGIKYGTKKVNLRDPNKLEIRKHEQETAMVPGGAPERATAPRPLGRECLDVKLWPRLEATPYGHFNKVDAHPRKELPKSTTGQRVLGDHYTRSTVEPRRAK